MSEVAKILLNQGVDVTVHALITGQTVKYNNGPGKD
jgi:hypothetical protein